MSQLFKSLKQALVPARPFENVNVAGLWNDPYISTQMLKFHLDPDNDPASRKGEFMDQSAQWIIDRFRLAAGKMILDLGCGPGLYTERFCRSGAAVTGLDFSANSIRYAKRQASEKQLNIRYIEGDYLKTDYEGSYDLITLIYCDYCAMPADQRKVLLNRIHSALKPGGHFLFDVHTDSFFNSLEEYEKIEHSLKEGFWTEGEHIVIYNRALYGEVKVISDKYVVTTEDREFTQVNHLQCFSEEMIRKEITGAGFELMEIFSDVSGRPFSGDSHEWAMVCRKV